MVQFCMVLMCCLCTIYLPQDLLFDLANVAGLEEKRAKMGTGQHINETEDRAGNNLNSLVVLLLSKNIDCWQ